MKLGGYSLIKLVAKGNGAQCQGKANHLSLTNNCIQNEGGSLWNMIGMIYILAIQMYKTSNKHIAYYLIQDILHKHQEFIHPKMA